MIKTEIPKETRTEFELVDIAANIEKRSMERGGRGLRQRNKKKERERDEARRSENIQQDISRMEETVAENHKELTRVKVKWTHRVGERLKALAHIRGAVRRGTIFTAY